MRPASQAASSSSPTPSGLIAGSFEPRTPRRGVYSLLPEPRDAEIRPTPYVCSSPDRPVGRFQRSSVETSRTVGAPAPNRVGHVFPHAEHAVTDGASLSGPLVPSWSQRSMRCPSFSHSTWTVIRRPSWSRLLSGAGRSTKRQPTAGVTPAPSSSADGSRRAAGDLTPMRLDEFVCPRARARLPLASGGDVVVPCDPPVKEDADVSLADRARPYGSTMFHRWNSAPPFTSPARPKWVNSSGAELVRDLGRLGAVIRQDSLERRSRTEVADLLDELVADRGTLMTLPELHELRTGFMAAGLAGFLAEMQARAVSEETVIGTFRYARRLRARPHGRCQPPIRPRARNG